MEKELTEENYLKTYDSTCFEKPSVTVDVLIFTILDEKSNNYRKLDEKRLSVLLIKRGGHPFKGRWAIPGGFLNLNESLEDGAKRELKEETGLFSNDIEYVGLYHESPSTLQYGLYCFIAKNCKKVSDLELEDSEVISGIEKVKAFEDLPKSGYNDAITEMLVCKYLMGLKK